MLAKSGAPFDSDESLFEIKWDGVRTLLFKDEDGVRVRSRNGNDIASLCPWAAKLGLPSGTVLDGELLAFRDGLPDFPASLDRTTDKVLVIFDILFVNYESVMEYALTDRKALLDSMAPVDERMTLSPVHAEGLRLFEHASDRELEGVVAKRRDSAYLAGRRSDSWIKIKVQRMMFCIVVGYVPGADGFKSLLLASNQPDGALTYVGKVGTGFTREKRTRIVAALAQLEAAEPIVTVSEEASWIESGLYCSVRYAELTAAGLLRSAVFLDIVDE